MRDASAARGRVDVWLACAARWAGEDREAAWAVLAGGERAHARGLPAPLGRHYTVARGVARAVLARCLGTAPHEVAIGPGPRGKPEVAGGGDVRFNLSHSEGLAALAVTARDEVGVDVERVRPFDGPLRFASAWCTPGELARLRAASGPARWDLLFGWWVRKEACAKAVGEGLRAPLAALEVDRGQAPAGRPLGLEVRVPVADGGHVSVWAADLALPPEEGYRGAVAATRPGAAVRLRGDGDTRALVRRVAAAC